MRILHTMIRVNNLEESVKFYCDVLGMKLLRKKDYPSGRFTLAFVGYGSESEGAVIELTITGTRTSMILEMASGTSRSASKISIEPVTTSATREQRSCASPGP